MCEWVTTKLANWTAGTRATDLSEEVLAKAQDCIIDAIACAIPGKDLDGSRAVRAVAERTFRNGDAVVWFDDTCLHAPGAAFANAAAVSILDIDDGHRHALGHPGAAVVPTALAAAKPDMPGLDVLAAIVVGYEVSVRIGMSERRKSYHSGNWTGFGAAATAAHLGGLSADQVMHALAIAAYHGPRIADLTLSRDMGSNVKESIPWSVVAGMMAADLAANGFTGCLDALDIEERFDPAVTAQGLGDEPLIMRTYFKRYSACRWTHTAVEGLLTVMRENGISADHIESVRVETFRQAANLDNFADPPTVESAQYSVPYCMAMAATLGEKALMPMSVDHLHYPPAVRFAKKIKVDRAKELDAGFPTGTPAKTVVTTSNGSFETFMTRPWGDPYPPPKRTELVDKFTHLARGRLSQERSRDIVAAVETLRNGSARTLLDALTGR